MAEIDGGEQVPRIKRLLRSCHSITQEHVGAYRQQDGQPDGDEDHDETALAAAQRPDLEVSAAQTLSTLVHVRQTARGRHSLSGARSGGRI